MQCGFGIRLAMAPLILLTLADLTCFATAEPSEESGLLQRAYSWSIAPIEKLGALAAKPMRHFSNEPAVCGPPTADCKPAAVEICRQRGYHVGRPIFTVTFKQCALPSPIGTGKCETLRRLEKTVCW